MLMNDRDWEHKDFKYNVGEEIENSESGSSSGDNSFSDSSSNGLGEKIGNLEIQEKMSAR